MSDLPKRKVPAPRPGGSAPSGQRASGGQAPRRTSSGQQANRPAGGNRRPANVYAPPPRRDMFPVVMGAIIGALVMGLVFVIFLLSTNNNQQPSAVNPNPGVNTNPTSAGSVATSPAGGSTTEPVRMTMVEFKSLYDDLARRPVTVDVRAKEAFDEGHITGAVNIPLPETDARIAEFPKDKLIVAYCQ